MIPLVAAIVLAGAAGAGPVLVSDACGGDTTDNVDAKCAVAEVERIMKTRPRPKELKVVSEGKLYTIPEDVEMIAPPTPPLLVAWWREFCYRVLSMTDRNSKSKESNSTCCDGQDLCSPGGKSPFDVPSVGEDACQICFEQDHSTAMLPCGHGGVCWDCGVQMYALTGECPMCRNKIDLLVRLDSETPRRHDNEEEFVSVVCA